MPYVVIQGLLLVLGYVVGKLVDYIYKRWIKDQNPPNAKTKEKKKREVKKKHYRANRKSVRQKERIQRRCFNGRRRKRKKRLYRHGGRKSGRRTWRRRRERNRCYDDEDEIHTKGETKNKDIYEKKQATNVSGVVA